ncbi:MAG: butyrate kinase, partial [Clostridiales bacterium]|nr:butyrate kinase [Clostridiales bacterium]
MRILAINPGSTSTKIAVYQGEEEVFRAVLEHSAADLTPFSSISSQYPMRRQAIYRILSDNQLLEQGFAAVVGRGGMLPPLQSGAYQVNQ